MGKFRQFIEVEAFEDDDMDEELGDDVNDPDECLLIGMDSAFPLWKYTKSRNNDIFQVLKHCYKYGVAPPLTLLHEESLIGDWQRIANALNHELYDKISSTFM
eukprot:893288_1